MSDNKQTNEKREMMADIVAEMRERADAMQTHGTTHGVRLAVLEFARRIEAAWKREREEVEADALEVGGIVEAARTAEKSSAVGNAAAMRDALLNIQEYAAAMDVDDGNVLAILDACRDALSAPPLQCDVGTAEEQAKRFHAFCDGHSSGIGGMCDGNCPCFGCVDGCHCLCKWSQMPYEAEEGGAK